MKSIALLFSVMFLSVGGTPDIAAQETLDTLLPTPGLVRRNPERLQIDAQTQQKIEKLYQTKEPKYHQLRYKVERLSNQLYPLLTAETLDEPAIAERMKALLDAETELKLYQVHVRVSLLSQLTAEQRVAARKLAKEKVTPTTWRGKIAIKVNKVRELSSQVAKQGKSLSPIEEQMKQVDRAFAAGKIEEGVRLLDRVINTLEQTLRE